MQPANTTCTLFVPVPAFLMTFQCALLSDAYGRKVQPAIDEDTFQVQWFGVFDSAGRITDIVVGSWQPRSAHFDQRSRPHS
eukprot:6208658-Pleurochrysis_carterae.AAC.3